MTRIHFIIHEAFEAPGAIETWAVERGHRASYSRTYLGEALPPSDSEIDMLVIMGGPQSPATSTIDCLHFDSAAEQALIRACADAGRMVIGICLGAQLIGQALGAPFTASPEPEIGKFPITLSAAGLANPKFAHFGEQLDVGHWHNDMPGLTESATVIASSAGCPRQIIEYGEFVYGFQCHMEFTSATIETMIAACGSDLAKRRGRRFVEQPEALIAHDWRTMNQALELFLDKLSASYEARRKVAAFG